MNGEQFAVNCDLVERVGRPPRHGADAGRRHKYIWAETLTGVVERVRDFRASVLVPQHRDAAPASGRQCRRSSGHPSPHRQPPGRGLTWIRHSHRDRPGLRRRLRLHDHGRREPAASSCRRPWFLVFVGTFGCHGLRPHEGRHRRPGRRQDRPHGQEALRRRNGGHPGLLAERARREASWPWRRWPSRSTPLHAQGIELAVDGTDPDELRDIMEAEIASKKAADKAGAKFFATWAASRPRGHHRHRPRPDPRAGEPVAAGEARPPHRRRLRRHPVGVLTANACAAHRQQAQAGRGGRGPPHAAGDGGRAGRAGRRQSRSSSRSCCRPARRRAPEDDREGGLAVATAAAKTHRRSKLHEEHEEHVQHERWLITYADMITLLMVLFIVLYSISRFDLPTFRRLKEGVAAGSAATRGRSPLRRGGPAPGRGRGLRRRPPRHAGGHLGQAAQAALATPRRGRPAPGSSARCSRGAAGIQRSLDQRPRRHRAVPAGAAGARRHHRERQSALRSGQADCGRRAGRWSTTGGRHWPAPNKLSVEATPTTHPSRALPVQLELSTARATTVLRELIERTASPRPASRPPARQRAPAGHQRHRRGRSANRRVGSSCWPTWPPP